jgi:hypothetical protein
MRRGDCLQIDERPLLSTIIQDLVSVLWNYCPQGYRMAWSPFHPHDRLRPELL